jgi:outer membrane receptor protein involved in Fe transport
VDLAIGGKVASFTWHAVYSFVDATYQSNVLLNSESNSTADADGNIQVSPGNRIPLIPRHTGRLVLNYNCRDQWDIGASVIAAAGSFLHGDENNANQPGGTNGEGAYVTGSGWSSGYTLMTLHGTYHMGKTFDVFARLVNVFDKHYATAGFLTSSTFNPKRHIPLRS